MNSALLRVAYAAQKKLWRLLRPRTHGVKVMLFDGAGALLLIRNNYGDERSWVLPGGGVRPWESADRAAAREVREELGCGLAAPELIGTFAANAEGKRDTVHLFAALCVGEPKVDAVEVAEARFFELDALPKEISPATRRRIDERAGRTTASARW